MKEENFNMDYVFGKEHRKAYMGFAMLWIIGYHFYLVQSEFIDHYLFPFKLLFRNGFVGVDIFFILSAYGLCCSWENSTVKSFYKKRFIRIIPLYVGFLILCKLILKTNHMVTDGMLQITSLSIFDTPYTKTKEMSGEWFVPAIINLYLIFPLLFNFVKCIDKRFPIFGAYAFSICTILISRGATSFISPNYSMRFPIIVAGIISYLCVKENNKEKLLGVFVLMSLFYFIIERKNIMLSVALPLLLFALNDLKIKIDRKWLNFIGAISFELYLAHIVPMNFLHNYPIMTALCIMIVGTIVLASLFHGLNIIVSKLK